MPQFQPLQDGDSNSICLPLLLRGVTEMKHVMHPEKHLPYMQCSLRKEGMLSFYQMDSCVHAVVWVSEGSRTMHHKPGLNQETCLTVLEAGRPRPRCRLVVLPRTVRKSLVQPPPSFWWFTGKSWHSSACGSIPELCLHVHMYAGLCPNLPILIRMAILLDEVIT